MLKFGTGFARMGAGLLVSLFVLAALSGVAHATVNPPPTCTSGQFCGNVYYSLYSGSVGYFGFVYNPSGPTFTFSTPTLIYSGLPHGADGLVFNPQNGQLLVGANDGSGNFNEVNQFLASPSVTTYPTSVPPLHIMVDPAGTTLWMDEDPGQLASVPLSPSIGSATTLATTEDGEPISVNTIMWQDQTHAFYTSDSSGFARNGATGQVGTIDLNTGDVTCFKTGTQCTVFNGVHGGVYDPFTGDLMVFGSNYINQISTTGTLVASEQVTSLSTFGCNCQFDQGAVDGKGHMFVAWNGGDIYFEDYSGGTIGTSNFNVISSQSGAFTYMDDLAPLVGSGSSQTPVPEFPVGFALLFALAVPILILFKQMVPKVRKIP